MSPHLPSIRKKPDDLQSYDRRALAYRGMKNYDAAIADYTFFDQKNPNDTEAMTKRGYTYSLAQQTKTRSRIIKPN